MDNLTAFPEVDIAFSYSVCRTKMKPWAANLWQLSHKNDLEASFKSWKFNIINHIMCRLSEDLGKPLFQTL